MVTMRIPMCEFSSLYRFYTKMMWVRKWKLYTSKILTAFCSDLTENSLFSFNYLKLFVHLFTLLKRDGNPMTFHMLLNYTAIYYDFVKSSEVSGGLQNIHYALNKCIWISWIAKSQFFPLLWQNYTFPILHVK